MAQGRDGLLSFGRAALRRGRHQAPTRGCKPRGAGRIRHVERIARGHGVSRGVEPIVARSDSVPEEIWKNHGRATPSRATYEDGGAHEARSAESRGPSPADTGCDRRHGRSIAQPLYRRARRGGVFIARAPTWADGPWGLPPNPG